MRGDLLNEYNQKAVVEMLAEVTSMSRPSLSARTHIELEDGSHLYEDAGWWIQSYAEGEGGGGADLGQVGDETDARESCLRLNCAAPARSNP